MESNRNDVPKFVRALMPESTERELQEATAALREYLAAVLRVHDRISRERTPVDSEKPLLSDRFRITRDGQSPDV